MKFETKYQPNNDFQGRSDELSWSFRNKGRFLKNLIQAIIFYAIVLAFIFSPYLLRQLI